MSADPLSPETRSSLLVRLQDPADQAAWLEFTQMYSPIIYRAARYKGLQDADAQDIVQQVLLSTAGALQKRPHDRDRAKFRTWLAHVTRNATLNALMRAKPDRGCGDSAAVDLLHKIPSPSNDEEIWLREEQNEMFRMAATRIAEEFEPDTWRSFWLTTVEGRSPEATAEQLGKRVGSVYAARSRIMRRLREEVQRIALGEG